MAPSGETHLPFGLAAVSALGGIFGYARKGSVPSLVGGLVFGAAYAGAGYLIQQVDAYQGHVLGTATSVLLAGVMGSRFSRTRKFMPAGLMAAAGLVGCVYHTRKMLEWKP